MRFLANRLTTARSRPLLEACPARAASPIATEAWRQTGPAYAPPPNIPRGSHEQHDDPKDQCLHEGSQAEPRTCKGRRCRATARTEVTKHNLQNPANKRNILCDATLKAVMGKDEVTMFEMTGLVGKHLGPT